MFNFRSLIAAAAASFSLIGYAQVTPIAEAPLNTGGVSIVRPNVTLLFDDSGSMEFQFTPDYLSYGSKARLCDNGIALVTGSTPSSRLSSAAASCPAWSYSMFRDGMGSWEVMAPSPPGYSPDINQQYYNPDVSYGPPVKSDLSTYPSMTGTSSANGGNGSATVANPNWKSIPLDGFKTYTSNTYNIESYPTYYFCDSKSSPNCAQDTSYNFPELMTNSSSDKRVRIEPNASGTAAQKAAFGVPYYYRLAVSYYCEDEQFSSCVKSTVPVNTYIYPARVRFCKDTDKAICQKNFDSSAGYIVPSYIHAPMEASAVAKVSTTTLNVKTLNGSGGTYSGVISSLMFNNVELGIPAISLNTPSANSLASTIAARLNSVPGFNATASGANVIIESDIASSASNGIPLYIASTAAIADLTTWTFKITGAAHPSLAKGNSLKTLKLGSMLLTSGTLTNSTTGNDAFDLGEVKNWAEDNGSNGYTANVSKAGNDIVIVLKRSNMDDYSVSDDTLTGNISTSRSSSGTKLGATSYNATKVNSTKSSASFSFNGGSTAASASGMMAGGKDSVVVEIDRDIWTRVDIAAGKTYPHSLNRVDCLGAVCTYKEEMTNFANWFSYYRFRMNSTKTAAGQAFARLNDNYRVGYHTINGSSSTIGLGVLPFDLTDIKSTAHRKKWYDKLYAQKTNGGTPLRSALSTVGRYYGGKLSGADPIEYSCQKNYTILVTDGYWNGGGGVDLSNSSLSTSQDSSTTSARSTRESGVFDGNNVGNTLADVAQYYYDIDLRPSGANSKNNVPTNARDDNNAQHMNTYTMGLGIDGLMTYRKDYLTASTGDFSKIISASTGCSWESSMSKVCNWPTPAADNPTAVDDLWHAAINGRGQYFSARTPLEAAEGIKQALSDVVSVTGAAAASATSSPNVTQSDNMIFSSTYQTSFWDGEVVAQRIDYQTGAILAAEEWKASVKINAQADALGANPNARTLLTLDTTATGLDKTKPFKYDDLSTTERNWFANHCTSNQLAQCAENLILTDRRPFADNAKNMVEYLRGRNDSDVFTVGGTPFGFTDIFRDLRTNRLGDTVNSVPLFLNKPVYTFDFGLPASHETYGQFITRVSPQCAVGDTTCLASPPAKRPGVLYMAANDGMLHALDGETGIERFAYVPRTTMPEMWRLSDQNYATRHRYFVDGSPVSMDISTSSGVWKTILVGGYRSGGAGYYALDVTDPTSPKVLWEVCNNAALCPNAIPNLGLSFGNPVITRLPDNHPTSPGRWVVLVTSGYNNVPSVNQQPTAVATGSGDGKGYLFVLDPSSGALIDTYSTNEGTVANPLNLGKLTTFARNFYFDGISTIAYSGDLRGNVWRFDLSKNSSSSNAVRKIAKLVKSGAPQPISTKIEIGLLPNRPEPVLYVATGQYISIDDLSDNSTQSLYAMRDPYFNEPVPPATPLANNFYGDPRAPAKKFVQQTISDVSVTKAGITSMVRRMSQNDVDWDTNPGWYLDFPDTGERVSLDPVLVLGTLTVSTNVVSSSTADACEVGGYSWLYQIDYTKGGSVPTASDDAVAYKVPGSLVVGTVIVRLPSGVLKIITTTATGAKIPYGLNVNTSGISGQRISWRELPQN